MSLAIKFGDDTSAGVISGAIYFDAVTGYSKDYSGRVTEHPIEAGASISDHFISDNPKFKISGVISGVDFSAIPASLSLGGEPVINFNERPAALTLSNLGSVLQQMLPGVVSQFIGNALPSVLNNSTGIRKNYKADIELLIEQLMSGLYYNETRGKWENKMTPCVLYEIDNGTPGRSIQNLVVTNCSMTEDAESGDALMIEVTLEQVKFVTLEKAEAPKPAKNTPAGRGATKSANKGNGTKTTEVPKTETIEKVAPSVEDSLGKARAAGSR